MKTIYSCPVLYIVFYCLHAKFWRWKNEMWWLISTTIFISYWLNHVRMMSFMKSSIFPIWLYQINTVTWRWFCPMTHFPRCTSTSGHCFSKSAKIEGSCHHRQCGPPAPTSVLSRSLCAGSKCRHICPRSSRRCGRCLRLRRVPEFLLDPVMQTKSLFRATCSTHCRIWGGIKIVNWVFFPPGADLDNQANVTHLDSDRS